MSESSALAAQTSQEAAAEMIPENVEEASHPKRKRVSLKLVLDRCLCGSVVNGLADGVLKCNQAGCETQWVSTAFFMWKSGSLLT